MKKLKGLLSVLLGVLFVFALAACGGDAVKYTVTFQSNGGTAVESYVLAEGETVEKPADPTKALFTFGGWYSDEACTQAYTFGQAMPANDFTLYALWNAQASSRVEYDSMGGTSVPASVGTVGSAITAPQDPTYEGYRFGGWYTDRECTKLFAFTVFPAENVTLYARWDKDPSYAYITYVGNDRTLGVQPVKKGETVAAPQFFGADIVASDWYTDANLTRAYTFGAASADVTLYASYYTRGLEFSGSTVTQYNGESANVVVPNRVNGTPIAQIGSRAFAEKDNVITVDLPAGIGVVGAAAFYRCRYLTSVNLSNRAVQLGANAFFGCTRLVSYGDITGVRAIPEGLFLGCEKLTAITLSSSATSVGAQAFADCALLKEMTIPDGVTAVGDGLFDGCVSLEKVALPASLATFGTDVFRGCGKLTSLSLAATNANFKLIDGGLYRGGNELLFYAGGAEEYRLPEGVRKIAAGAFDSNSTVKSIVIGNASADLACGAFSGIKSLESLSVPVLGGTGCLAYYFGASAQETAAYSAYIPASLRSVTLTGSPTSVSDYAFIGAVGLEEVKGLENVTSVGDYAFAYSGLCTFDVSARLTEIGNNAFAGCSSLTEFRMSGSSTAFSVHDGCLYNGAGTKLLFVPSAKTTVSFPSTVTEIATAAFADSAIETVAVPDTVTFIDYAAFRGCGSVRELTVPFIGNGKDVTYMAYIFGTVFHEEQDTDEDGNSYLNATLSREAPLPGGLKKITVTRAYPVIPNFAFAFFTGLEEVVLKGDITQYGAYSFFNTSLKSADLSKVTSVGDMAFRMTSLTELSFPATLQTLGYGAFGLLRDVERITFAENSVLTEIAPQAFAAYTATAQDEGVAFYSAVASRIEIPASVQKIGSNAFYGVGMDYNYDSSSNWANVGFSVSFAASSALKEIGKEAFSHTGLTSVTLPTTLQTVGERAFADCSDLERVVFGSATGNSALKTLGKLCFEGCTALKSVTMYVNRVVAMEKDGENDVFYGASEDFAIYVPSGVVSDFTADDNWSKYTSRISAVVATQGGTN